MELHFSETTTHQISPSPLTHLPLDKMAAIMADDIFKCIFFMEMIKFKFKFHWNLFPRVQVTINQQQGITWTNDDPVHWCIYAALGGDELTIWEYISLKNYIHHLNSMKITFWCNSILGHQIATQFCTCHNSQVLRACAQVCRHHIATIWIIQKQHLFWFESFVPNVFVSNNLIRS